MGRGPVEMALSIVHRAVRIAIQKLTKDRSERPPAAAVPMPSRMSSPCSPAPPLPHADLPVQLDEVQAAELQLDSREKRNVLEKSFCRPGAQGSQSPLTTMPARPSRLRASSGPLPSPWPFPPANWSLPISDQTLGDYHSHMPWR